MRAIQLIHEGAIGQVYHARGECFRRRFSIGHTPDTPTPPGLNWDLFLGPAPLRPFNEKRFAYYWHWFWDTGNGDIGNQGVHEMGVARWGLSDPEWPTTAFATGGKYIYNDDQETPNTLLATFDFPTLAVNCDRRATSTSATQSLVLMNSEFILSQASHLARRVRVSTLVGAASDRLARQAACAWELVYQRTITPEETAWVNEYGSRQLSKPGPDCELAVLTNLCQQLLISNEFLYVD